MRLQGADPLAPPPELKFELAQAGFQGVELRAEGPVLILRLKGEDRIRLFAQPLLRVRLTERAKAAGFQRIALELGVQKGSGTL